MLNQLIFFLNLKYDILNALKTLNSEFYRRVTNREMAGKIPTKTAQKGCQQTETWIKELENK